MDIKKLIIDTKEKRKKIDELTNMIVLLKEELRENEKKIWNICEHSWVRNVGCFDDIAKEYCNICGLWRNKYMYI